ncbi:transposase [Streptomyces sp. NPDC005202]|uniref:transposase n=1 Tax=Streptomyces sp. NPDC005202 TaxID=3157021 RepID=UPI0033BC4024
MPAPRKYPLELRERAVRMYRTSEPKPVIRRMAEELGVHHEALRGWIRQAEADAGERDDLLTTVEREELAALRKERANEVLRMASAFFAAQLDPTRPRLERSSTSTHTWGSSPYSGNCTSPPPPTTAGARPRRSRARDAGRTSS